jgi:lipopolysaccharide transport system ATP-binding protein
MPLHLRKVQTTEEGLPVALDLSFEDSILLGITGPNGSGKSTILRLIAGEVRPESGRIEGFRTAHLAAASINSACADEVRKSVDAGLAARPDVLLVGPGLCLTDPEYQSAALAKFRELQRGGSIVVLVSQDLTFLERYCDEVMVVERGRILERGDPRQVLEAYRVRTIERARSAARLPSLNPASRHGDGRARILAVEIQRAGGETVAVVQSGETVTIRVNLEFREAVENPVVGILIRSRIGVNVYGTNTELEKAAFGPCRAGDRVELLFILDCHLCAEQYTLTVASHDPDGTAHEWLEEAIVFTVADTRYTAGVANLRARVEVRR